MLTTLQDQSNPLGGPANEGTGPTSVTQLTDLEDRAPPLIQTPGSQVTAPPVENSGCTPDIVTAPNAHVTVLEVDNRLLKRIETFDDPDSSPNEDLLNFLNGKQMSKIDVYQGLISNIPVDPNFDLSKIPGTGHSPMSEFQSHGDTDMEVSLPVDYLYVSY